MATATTTTTAKAKAAKATKAIKAAQLRKVRLAGHATHSGGIGLHITALVSKLLASGAWKPKNISGNVNLDI